MTTITAGSLRDHDAHALELLERLEAAAQDPQLLSETVEAYFQAARAVEAKVDGVASVVRDLEARARACAKDAAKLAPLAALDELDTDEHGEAMREHGRAEGFANRAAGLRRYLALWLKQTGRKEVHTENHRVVLVGESVVIR